MSKVSDTVFGDSGAKAAKTQSKENEASRAIIEQQAELARSQAIPLFDAASQNRQAGTQAGLDVLGQSIPQQFQAFQQGNVGAQDVLGRGSQQFQNAIFGQPVDRSFLQPQTIDFSTAFAQQQLPQFVSTQQALNPVQPQVDPNQIDFSQFFNKFGGF